MRQVGVLAAAGLVALEEGPYRLRADHDNARLMARLLAEIPTLGIYPQIVQTNIFMIDVASTGYSASHWVSCLRERSVWISALDQRMLRAVTHMDVSREDVLMAVEAFRQIASSSN